MRDTILLSPAAFKEVLEQIPPNKRFSDKAKNRAGVENLILGPFLLVLQPHA